jgi:hypothetical protein
VSQAKKQNKNGISVTDRAYAFHMAKFATRYFFIGLSLISSMFTGYCGQPLGDLPSNNLKSISAVIVPKGSYFDVEIEAEINQVEEGFIEKVTAGLALSNNNVESSFKQLSLTQKEGPKFSGKIENFAMRYDRITITQVFLPGNSYYGRFPNDTVYTSTAGEKIPVVSISLIPDLEGPVLLSGTTSVSGAVGDELPLSIDTLWSDRGQIAAGSYRIIPPTYFAPENNELCMVRKVCVYATGNLRINSLDTYNLAGSDHLHNFWRSGEYVFEFSAADKLSYGSSYYFFPSLSATHYVTSRSVGGRVTNVPIIKRTFAADPQLEDTTPPVLSNIYFGTRVLQPDGRVQVPIITEWTDQHVDASSLVKFKSCATCTQFSFTYAGGNAFRYLTTRAIGTTVTIGELIANDHAANVTLYYIDEARSTTHYMILSTGMGTAQVSPVPIFRQIVNP